MREFTKTVYLSELNTQCEFALTAHEVMMFALDSVRGSPRPFSMPENFAHREVFRSVHSFLTHTSNISKILWPPPVRGRAGESKEERKNHNDLMQANAESIRAILGLGEEINILQNRDLRDHLEHFNERILDWDLTSKRHIFVQDYIGPPGGFGGVDSRDSMRQLDPTTMIFSFRSEVYSLREMFDSVLKIYNVLGTILKH